MNIIALADKRNCTGCGLCKNVCPVGAISLIPDLVDGFLYPQIEAKKCIKCGRCREFCPEITIKYTRVANQVRAFAAFARDSQIRNSSSSGGMFFALAAHVLKMGGSVSGAIYDKDLYVRHCLISDIRDIQPLLLSKYIQSDTGNIYHEIAKTLSKGQQVLFCGTPCQVSALKQYIEQLHLEKGLFLVDLFCRGVPSAKAAHKFIKELEAEYGKKVVFVTLKDKTFGWHRQKSKYLFEDGTSIVLEDDAEDFFARSFLWKNLCIRESCFHCKYKSTERNSDISIGDFWGICDTEMDNDKGTSAVFIHTEKGMKLFTELMETDIICKEYEVEDITKGNPDAFTELKNFPKQRTLFWKLLETKKYKEAVLEAESAQV